MINNENKFKVYAHVNKTDKKIYIGITCQNVVDRWKNGKGYEYNIHFWSAIQKYGWDGFKHVILAEDLTEAEASKIESHLIEKFETTKRNKGYNFAPGGLHNRSLKGELNPLYGKVPTKAVEASVKARTGVPLSDEHKEKIRQGNIRAGSHPNSLKVLDEHRHDKKPYLTGSNNPKSTAVKCLETGIVYESQLIAEREMNLPRGSVYQAIKNNIRAKGYHFIRMSNSNDQPKGVGSSESKRRDAKFA